VNRPALLMAGAMALAALAVAGCSGANPVAAAGDAAENGMTKGQEAQVTSALTAANQAVAAWSVEHGSLPSPTDFSTISGAGGSGGATVTYQASGAGYCLTALSSGQPQVVRVLKEPGGLQPEGTTC
jgi:hypothetical protein